MNASPELVKILDELLEETRRNLRQCERHIEKLEEARQDLLRQVRGLEVVRMELLWKE